jgi:hypothetical protein
VIAVNIINLRKELRRSQETRRVEDRRKVPYPFGTPEWEEHIKRHYLAWPKTNRRVDNRRSNERRSPDRREQQLTEQSRSLKKYARVLLTAEERKLIEDLYLSDLE